VYWNTLTMPKSRPDKTRSLSVAENRDQPDRELFVWAVLFSRMRIAMIFWKTCPDQIGAALVANLIFKSMAHKAELSEELQMADELLENARFVLPTAYWSCTVIRGKRAELKLH